MSKKSRSPKEIAKDKPTKKNYGFSLEVETMTKLQEMADRWDLSVSELVDEAVKGYVKEHYDKESNPN